MHFLHTAVYTGRRRTVTTLWITFIVRIRDGLSIGSTEGLSSWWPSGRSSGDSQQQGVRLRLVGISVASFVSCVWWCESSFVAATSVRWCVGAAPFVHVIVDQTWAAFDLMTIRFDCVPMLSALYGPFHPFSLFLFLSVCNNPSVCLMHFFNI